MVTLLRLMEKERPGVPPGDPDEMVRIEVSGGRRRLGGCIQERSYPLPNGGDPNTFAAGTFRQTASRHFDRDTYTTAKSDHQIVARHQIFARAT